MGVCIKPVPGVVNVDPRVFPNTVNGVTAAVPFVAPPPSQLIARKPVGRGPPVFPLSTPPSAASKLATTARRLVKSDPEPEKTIGTAWALVVNERVRIEKIRRASLAFDTENLLSKNLQNGLGPTRSTTAYVEANTVPLA
jgi:hypothetical protein